MMFPSLRGGNDNPGMKEGFLGEVDDVMAAAAYLRKQPYFDPDRVYLGGHSIGGTMALLTAECSDSFRAVFSFGPTDDVLGYGLGDNPFSLTDPKELRLRSPAQWLHSIRSPVFVFEVASGGNAGVLRSMASKTKNPKVHFFVIKGANHFNPLGPTNRLIVGKVLKDTGPACNLTFTEEEVNQPFLK
jgi:dienelactone hydrolase